MDIFLLYYSNFIELGGLKQFSYCPTELSQFLSIDECVGRRQGSATHPGNVPQIRAREEDSVLLVGNSKYTLHYMHACNDAFILPIQYSGWKAIFAVEYGLHHSANILAILEMRV